MSVRLQPNHPFDDARGITASILDGILLGSGDACIGINPASDDPAVIGGLAAAARRHHRAAADPDAGLRADPCHHHARIDRAGRSGRSGVPVDRGHARPPTAVSASISRCCARRIEAGLSLRRGTVGRQCDVFRDRAGLGAVGQRPSRCRSADPARRGPMRWRAPSIRCWSTAWSASSARNISMTARRSSAPGWRIISAASCSACRSASTSATPTMPRPTRTTWTIC